MRERQLLVGSLIVLGAASGFGLLGPLARFAAGIPSLLFLTGIQAVGGLAILLAAVLLQRSGAPLAPTPRPGPTLATGVER